MSADSANAPRVSRPLQILLAVVVLAALAFAALTLLGGGGDEVTAVAPTADLAGPSEVATAGPGDASSPDAGVTPEGDGSVVDPDDDPPPARAVVDARDPFQQLAQEASGGAGAGAAVPPGEVAPVADTQPTTATPPTAPQTGDPQPIPPGSQPLPPADGGPSPPEGSGTVVDQTTIVLQDVFVEDGVETALVTVADIGYEVVEGQTVADELTVLEITGSCVTMRYDEARFILCKGEQISK